MSAQFGKISSHVPHYLTRFIGREREIAQLKQLLTAEHDARLITLTGVGGCGKTRLAAEVARAFTNHRAAENVALFGDGACWVDLTSLSDRALVPQTVAAALGLRETTGSSPTDALLAALRQAHLLLVLDNCEHLAGAAASSWLLGPGHPGH